MSVWFIVSLTAPSALAFEWRSTWENTWGYSLGSVWPAQSRGKNRMSEDEEMAINFS
jgi:hypothetical protein